jgi:glycosyltransferase involved in cell wall biosynthesis
MRILHLSADYPDPVSRQKPRAIANLVALGAAAGDTQVISLNRRGPLARFAVTGFDDAAGRGHRAVCYPAAPLGIGLRQYLERLADWAIADCTAQGRIPDIVHAHKLSVEGIVGWRMARAWGVPLVLSVQGNTDLKVLRMKPLLRPHLRRIWTGAAAALPYAPWAAEGVARYLGPRTGPTVLLPCPGPADRVMAPVACGPRLVSAFHLADHHRKNAARLIRAAGLAAREVPGLSLEILGGGDAAVTARLAALARAEAPGVVELAGPLSHDAMQARVHAAAGFALVSRAESFGMVFAEALLAGTPCLYPRGQAIHGYFEEGGFVLAAAPHDTAGIAAGLVRLVREETALKARLAAAQDAGALDFLRQDTIAAAYRGALAAASARFRDAGPRPASLGRKHSTGTDPAN